MHRDVSRYIAVNAIFARNGKLVTGMRKEYVASRSTRLRIQERSKMKEM